MTKYALIEESEMLWFKDDYDMIIEKVKMLKEKIYDRVSTGMAGRKEKKLLTALKHFINTETHVYSCCAQSRKRIKKVDEDSEVSSNEEAECSLRK